MERTRMLNIERIANINGVYPGTVTLPVTRPNTTNSVAGIEVKALNAPRIIIA